MTMQVAADSGTMRREAQNGSRAKPQAKVSTVPTEAEMCDISARIELAKASTNRIL